MGPSSRTNIKQKQVADNYFRRRNSVSRVLCYFSKACTSLPGQKQTMVSHGCNRAATQLVCLARVTARIGCVSAGNNSTPRFPKPRSRHLLSLPGSQAFHTTCHGGRAELYDVLVVGLGAFGSSILYHLSKAGLKVAGLERYHPAHERGSSHGQSRIIRLAYMEGPQYVPLLKRSYNLFFEVQGTIGQPLYMRTGMLDIGQVFARSLLSAQQHQLEHEVLTGQQVNRMFPGYNIPSDWQALFQPDGGILAPEKIIKAHCKLAEQQGAHTLAGQLVSSWKVLQGGAVRVMTQGGATYEAAQLVLAAGPWIRQLVPQLKEMCVPERQVVGWFDFQDPRMFQPQSFPVFIIEDDDAAYYGFPQYGDQKGFKIGKYHHLFEAIDPDDMSRTVTLADASALRQGVQRYFPSANGQMLHHSTCMFTNTPDGHFIIDRHPVYDQVILCSACSGHGFKMSSGVGQLIADMVLQGGKGSVEIQEELALHRLNATRPGVSQALKLFGVV